MVPRGVRLLRVPLGAVGPTAVLFGMLLTDGVSTPGRAAIERDASPQSEPISADTVFPGSSIARSPVVDTRGSVVGQEVRVSIPNDEFHVGGSPDLWRAAPAPAGNDVLAAAQVGWKGSMLAAAVARQDQSVVAYRIETTQAVSPGAENYLHGVLRRSEGDELAEAFSVFDPAQRSDAVRQAKANLAVISDVLGRGVVRDSSVAVVPIDTRNGQYALEVTLSVSDVMDLQPHLGDVVMGPAVGLLGSGPQRVAGLAIHVVDEKGRRAGWWRAPTAGIAFGLWPPELTPAGPLSVDTDFPNLIAGPPPVTAVPGSDVSWASGPSE